MTTRNPSTPAHRRIIATTGVALAACAACCAPLVVPIIAPPLLALAAGTGAGLVLAGQVGAALLVGGGVAAYAIMRQRRKARELAAGEACNCAPDTGCTSNSCALPTKREEV